VRARHTCAHRVEELLAAHRAISAPAVKIPGGPSVAEA
jgi:spore maturation protein CgeB